MGGAGALFLIGLWCAALALSLVSLRFCMCLGLAGLLAIYAPSTQGAICGSIGLLHFLLRPRRERPHALLMELSERHFSTNYRAWAKTNGFRLDSPGWEAPLRKQCPQSQFALTLSWLRGPGLQNTFCMFWELHSLGKVALHLVLDDLPKLRHAFQIVAGKSAVESTCGELPLEAALQNRLSAPLRQLASRFDTEPPKSGES